MANLAANIRSYADAVEFLGDKRSKRLGHNTYVESRWTGLDLDHVAVRLHYTDVVTYHRDGRVVINTGGWNTPTTFDRIGQTIPQGYAVSYAQRAVKGHPGSWVVYGPAVGADHYRTVVASAHRTATIHPDGTVTGDADNTEGA